MEKLKQLEKAAAGRDHLETYEFARFVCTKRQTIHKMHMETGQCFGITPVRVGKKLLWPVAAIADLLGGNANEER